jgi:hypothetical protein
MHISRRLVAVAAAGTCLLGAAVSASGPAAALEPRTGHAGPAAGVVLAKASGHAKPQRSQSPNLTYHGGPVITSGTVVQAIFWGTSWSNSSFVADKVTGMDSFYAGLGGSSYGGTNTEYTDASGAHVNAAVSYAGHLVDTTAAPSGAPQTSQILAEVANRISNPVANGYYPVYVDTPRGHAGYCAWHSYGTVGTVVVQFAFFFNLDNDSGCDPQDASNAHTQGTAALGNVSGHEWSEMVTDRHVNAWYDAQGAENADKCAWTFGANSVRLGGSSWKIQGNWSNAAYNANQGYLSGGTKVRGCIDGTN